ncbi:hypothetical protein TgHK011_006031 [Trichoderma gracile]|nr:hypothetical protein TgHK011_006031 [Trichoderma gracile]
MILPARAAAQIIARISHRVMLLSFAGAASRRGGAFGIHLSLDNFISSYISQEPITMSFCSSAALHASPSPDSLWHYFNFCPPQAQLHCCISSVRRGKRVTARPLLATTSKLLSPRPHATVATSPFHVGCWTLLNGYLPPAVF